MRHTQEIIGIGAVTAALFLRHITASRRKDLLKAKPQLKFSRVLANNSDEPFLHLSEDLTSYQAGPDQSHPLLQVIERLSPADQSCLESVNQDANKFAKADCCYVKTSEALEEAAEQLAKAEVIGVDIEHNHLRSYRGIVCLIQLNADGRNYIIDVLEVHDLMHKLRSVFADPQIVKVVHGGENDILWLQRDFHIYIANLFDTEKAAAVLGKKERSLQVLLREYAGIAQDKSHQLDDWRQRPLSEDMLEYAITDAHYLPFLAATLRDELSAKIHIKGDAPLDQAFQRSQAVASEMYAKTSTEEAVQIATASIWKRRKDKEAGNGKQGRREVGQAIQRRIAGICHWRDLEARYQDEGVQYILSNSLLWDLATTDPQSEGDALILVDTIFEGLQNLGGYLSSSRAHKGKRKELAQLVYQPPGLGLADKDPVASKKKGPGLSRAEKRLAVAKKFSAKRQVYENCRMLSQAGELLCFCDMRKVRWYEAKGLGKRVCEDPPTIRLTFEHKIGDQDLGQDAFYTASRDNRCVVCASKTHLLRYRIVPACYRKNFPVHQKSHRSHDVVLLCFNCHEAAQKSAEQVKREIARDTGVPLTPPPPPGKGLKEGAPPPYQVRHAAVALRAAGEKMPNPRQEMLEGLIKRHLDASDIQTPFEGLQAEPAYQGSNLSLAMLDEGLLAGLGPKRRKQNLRRMQERDKKIQDARSASEGPSLVEASGSEEEAGTSQDAEQRPGSSEALPQRDSAPREHRPQEAGHMWHGRQVVESLMERGGEDAVNSMIQRFRAAFVAATNPQHLPPFWKVDHNAVRQFGEYSVYKQEEA